MKEQAPIQYTVRGVPADVDRALREKARRSKQSLNQVILRELADAANVRKQRADFSDLVGRWVSDPGFDEIIAAQRQIDWERWK